MKNQLSWMLSGLLFSCCAVAHGLVNESNVLPWRPAASMYSSESFSDVSALMRRFEPSRLQSVSEVSFNPRAFATQWLAVQEETDPLRFMRWHVQSGLVYSQVEHVSDQYGLIPLLSSQARQAYLSHTNVLSRQVLAQTKWLYPYSAAFSPYLVIGLGGALSTAAYDVASTPSLMSSMRDYATHTSSNFAYRLGFGADLHLATTLHLGLSYHFSDRSGFGGMASSLQAMNRLSVLSSSSLASNEILAQLKYII